MASGPRKCDQHRSISRLTQKLDVPFLRSIILYGMKEMGMVQAFLSRLQTTRLQSLLIDYHGLSVNIIDEFLPQTLSFDPRSNLCNCIRLEVEQDDEEINVTQYLVDDMERRLFHDPKYVSLRRLHDRGPASTLHSLRRLRRHT